MSSLLWVGHVPIGRPVQGSWGHFLNIQNYEIVNWNRVCACLPWKTLIYLPTAFVCWFWTCNTTFTTVAFNRFVFEIHRLWKANSRWTMTIFGNRRVLHINCKVTSQRNGTLTMAWFIYRNFLPWWTNHWIVHFRILFIMTCWVFSNAAIKIKFVISWFICKPPFYCFIAANALIA